jgi:predicted anti-sigma-YlaC factor YlaD
MIACSESRLLLGAYTLGGLEEEQAAELRAHLATCTSCSEKHDRLARVVSMLDIAGPLESQPLPQGLEERLVAQAVQAHASSTRQTPRGRWRSRLAPALVGAAVGAAVVVSLLAAFGLLGASAPLRVPSSTAHLTATSQAPNASAVAYVITMNGTSTVALQAQGLPHARADQHYIVWVSSPHGSYSAGTIQVTPTGWATAILRFPRTVYPGSLVQISLVSTKSGNGAYRPLAQGTLPS